MVFCICCVTLLLTIIFEVESQSLLLQNNCAMVRKWNEAQESINDKFNNEINLLKEKIKGQRILEAMRRIEVMMRRSEEMVRRSEEIVQRSEEMVRRSELIMRRSEVMMRVRRGETK